MEKPRSPQEMIFWQSNMAMEHSLSWMIFKVKSVFHNSYHIFFNWCRMTCPSTMTKTTIHKSPWDGSLETFQGDHCESLLLADRRYRRGGDPPLCWSPAEKMAGDILMFAAKNNHGLLGYSKWM